MCPQIEEMVYKTTIICDCISLKIVEYVHFRFCQNQDPEPPSSWEGIRDASKSCGTVCSQIDQLTEQLIGGEDCLYLNIYIPNELDTMARKPVMVWIHGGAYIMGSGNDVIYQPDYLMAKNVILITINYRLGALGKICIFFRSK
jgi:carboxylesterase type B